MKVERPELDCVHWSKLGVHTCVEIHNLFAEAEAERLLEADHYQSIVEKPPCIDDLLKFREMVGIAGVFGMLRKTLADAIEEADLAAGQARMYRGE